jgi:hypothetical protein
MKYSLFIGFAILILHSCDLGGVGLCSGKKGTPGASRASVTINGQVFGVQQSDTVAISGATAEIVYSYGFDTDCGPDFGERVTLKTDDSGKFKMEEKAYQACYYYYEISKAGYYFSTKGNNYYTDGSLCPDSLNGIKVYLTKN